MSTHTIEPSPLQEEWTRFVFKSVTADYEVGMDGSISIFEFQSKNSGCGEAQEALEKLSEIYATIIIESVFSESDVPNAQAFWQRMLDKGTVSEVRLADGGQLCASTDTELEL